MALTPGTKLGPYEIQSLLGAGGMGEVYRARDTRLDREVAIKILPAAVSADSDRLHKEVPAQAELGRGTRLYLDRISWRNHGSLHLDFHAHPGMDAALKTMFTFRQTRDLDMAALQDSSPSHRDLPKAAVTFGNRGLSRPIEARYEAATELRDLGEGVGLAALVDDAEGGSLPHVDRVRFEVPIRVGSSSMCLSK